MANGEGDGNKLEVIIDEVWKKKRTTTFFLIFLHRFTVGLDFSMTQSTMLAYVTNGMHLTHPELFYGFITGSKFLAALLFTLPLSRWFEINRRFKICVIAITTITTVGNLIYMIPNSPYFPVIGSAFSGFLTVLSAIKNSEILRVYTGDDIQQMFLLNLIAYGCGECVGPICVKLLDNVDFWIGGLHIMYGNVQCLILISFSVIRIVLSCFLVHDLSREFDLKAYYESNTESTIVSGMSYVHTIKAALGRDAILLLVLQFYSGFWTMLLPRLFPLIIQELHFSNYALDLCYVLSSISVVVICLIVRALKLSSKGVYYCGVVNLLTLCFAHIILLLISKGFNDAVNTFLVLSIVLGYALSSITENIFILTTLGKLVPSSNQSVVESIRYTVKIIAAMLSSYLSAYIYNRITYVFPVSCLALLLLLIGVFVRRERLSNPEVETATEEECSHLMTEEDK